MKLFHENPIFWNSEIESDKWETISISLRNLYWLATSGGRVPEVAVCVLHTQLRICCATDSAIL